MIFSHASLRAAAATMSLLVLIASGPRIAHADPELPMGSLSGCPFIHEDNFDIRALLETLKAQLATELDNKNACRQAVQSVVSTLAPLQNFYANVDPTLKQKITKSVYGNALNGLLAQKLDFESKGDTASYNYQTVVSEISAIENSTLANEVDLQSLGGLNDQNTEAYYRTQLLNYTSNVLGAFNSTARSNPACIGSMGGWETALSTIMGGVSLGTSLGANPHAGLIGAAMATGAQLLSLLQDQNVRTAYNSIVRLKNDKTLACTYFAIKKASCEYGRAFRISQDSARLREFVKNKFGTGHLSEYQRFFVNRGRVNVPDSLFAVIAQMGSPLTLDETILNAYLTAKAVDFDALGLAPSKTDSIDKIKSWLLRARAFGVIYSEFNYQTAKPVPLLDQLQTALDDIDAKRTTITGAENLIRGNLSFLDLRRRISSEFPNVEKDIVEMRDFLASFSGSAIVSDTDKGALDAALKLLNRLQDFLDVALQTGGKTDPAYEDHVVAKGGAIFEELAKGSVAQLTKQSVLALSGKGTDRLNWAFGVIRNGYLSRDRVQNLPIPDRFSEFEKNQNVLSDVIGNYEVFSGPGTSFREEDFTTAIRSFTGSFKKEILESLELALDEKSGGIPELRGQTAAQLCAMYAPLLDSLSRRGLFGDNRAAKINNQCHSKFKTLPLNRLVADTDFPIQYENECTYFDYSREINIEYLLAHLLQP
jgi:hypothetical protein